MNGGRKKERLFFQMTFEVTQTINQFKLLPFQVPPRPNFIWGVYVPDDKRPMYPLTSSET
jgi:hypothetical protein